MKLILILILISFCAVSFAQTDLKPARPVSPKDKVIYVSKSNDVIKQIAAAKTLAAKLEAVTAFKIKLIQERTDAQKAVVNFKGDSKKLTTLQNHEMESIYWMLAFEHVFDGALDAKFKSDTEFRSTTCHQVPNDIEFSELSTRPDGAELSDYGKLATEMMKKICSP